MTDSDRDRHARVVAVANQKGGVGKTTTAINVATSIAVAGRRVLLIDVDPQGNLTSGVGLKGERAPGGTIYEALMSEADAETFVLPTRVDNLFLIPAGGLLPLQANAARQVALRVDVDEEHAASGHGD